MLQEEARKEARTRTKLAGCLAALGLICILVTTIVAIVQGLTLVALLSGAALLLFLTGSGVAHNKALVVPEDTPQEMDQPDPVQLRPHREREEDKDLN